MWSLGCCTAVLLRVVLVLVVLLLLLLLVMVLLGHFLLRLTARERGRE